MDVWPPIFGVQFYDGLPLAAVLALFGFYLAAFFVKGALGFGNLSMIILFGALVLPPHHAVLVAVTASAMSQLQFVGAAIRDGDWRITRPVIVWYFATSAIGVYIFGKLTGSWLQVALGLALGTVLIADMAQVVARLADRVDLRAPRILYPFSAASGLVSGITGGGGLFFIALYVKQFSPDPTTFRGTILQLGMIFTLWRVGLLVAGGFITPKIVGEQDRRRDGALVAVHFRRWAFGDALLSPAADPALLPVPAARAVVRRREPHVAGAPGRALARGRAAAIVASHAQDRYTCRRERNARASGRATRGRNVGGAWRAVKVRTGRRPAPPRDA